LRDGGAANFTQHRVRTEGDTKALCEARSGFSATDKANAADDLGKTRGSSCMGGCHFRQAFSKDALRTRLSTAEKSPGLPADDNAGSKQGKVPKRSPVATMNAF